MLVPPGVATLSPSYGDIITTQAVMSSLEWVGGAMIASRSTLPVYLPDFAPVAV